MKPNGRMVEGLETVDGRELDFDATYRMVRDSNAVAWVLWGMETEPDEDTEWSGCENDTGKVLVCMVGDDHYSAVDPDDIGPVLEDEDYCSGCGQVGCGWS